MRRIITLLIKLGSIHLLVFLLKALNKQKVWTLNKLMAKGDLNSSEYFLKNLKVVDNDIFQRVSFMLEVKKNGFTLHSKNKNSIQKINILFAVHNSFPYDKAGYAIRTHMIATNLQKICTLVQVATRPGYPWDIQKHRGLDQKNKIDIIDGIKYRRLLDDEKIFKKGSDLNYIQTYANELVKFAKESNSTILHAHSNYLNAWGAIYAGNELKIPVIYEIRGLWHLTKLTIDSKYKYNGMFEYEEQMVKGAAASADAVVVISEALKSLLLEWGIESSKIHVIPNAVDIDFFQPKLKSLNLVKKYELQNKFVIGFLGSVTAYEGLDYLIKAVNDFSNEKKDMVLMIVGDGKELDSLKKLVKTKNVIFVGRVPHSEVKEYYTIFDICAYPRTKHEVTEYVPPLKPLEAMAMKVPVIVSDLVPLMEMVEDKDTGLICKADDLESLKEKIIELYGSKELRSILAENAYNWVQKERNWNTNITKYQILYDSFKEGGIIIENSPNLRQTYT